MRLMSLLFMALALAGCRCHKSIERVDVPVTVHDSIYISSVVKATDTIRQTERVWMVDTMYIDTSTVATLGLPVLRHDRTSLIERGQEQNRVLTQTDTATHTKEKPVTVTRTEYVTTNKLLWWQKALMWLGGVAMAVVCVTITIKLRKR